MASLRPASNIAYRMTIVQASSRSLIVALALVAVWVLSDTSARADFIYPVAEFGSEVDFGAADSGNAMPADREKKDDGLTTPSRLFIPLDALEFSTQAGAGGAGATGSTGIGGSGSPAGLIVRPPLPMLEAAGRLSGAYVTYHPPPFASGIFHPPRAA
jgi:hypothetical protein